MQAQSEAVMPWYRHPWPWILISIPLSAICVGSFFIYQAIHGADPMVQEQYYAAGQSINKVIAAGQQAQRMGLNGMLTLSPNRVSVQLHQTGKQPLPPVLNLQLSHPTIASLDQTVTLMADAGGGYSAALKPGKATRWEITLTAPDNSWSLSGAWRQQDGAQATLSPTDIREAEK